MDHALHNRRSEAPHLCLVSSELDPVTQGGIGALVRRLLEELAGSGFRCTLLLDASAPTVRRARRRVGRALPRVEVLGVAEVAANGGPPAHAFPNDAYWRSHRVWRALEAIHSRGALDAVEFHDFGGLGFVPIKAKRLGLGTLDATPLWVRVHGTGELADEADGRRRAEPRLRQVYRMERYALQHADAVLSPSPSVTDAYEARHPLAGRRVDAPPPIERLGPGAEHVPPAPGRPLRLLFYGKLQPLKGVEDLVRAALVCLERRGADALELHLAGSDAPGRVGASHRAELVARIPDCFAPCFHFHGRIDRQRARALACASDAAVFPSRTETFCLSAHELRWIGIPLLLADLPAFRDHFREGRDAIYFDSADSLARLLEDLSRSRASLRPLSARRPALPDPVAPYRDLVEHRPATAARGPASRPLVSVVIPYHEMHRYIDATLHSVERSDWAHWEVVLVDDGSRTAEARERFTDLQHARRGDPRFTFVRQANRGLASARNRGIEHARGSYLLPLDADDLLHPAYLRRAVKALERRSDLSFVSCFAALFRDGSTPSRAVEWLVPYDPDPAHLLYENGAGTAACVFRRSVFEKHRYDESLPAYEDWDLHLRLALDSFSGEVLPQQLFYYRVRNDSLVRRAHALHDLILSRMIDRHFPDAPDPIREGLKIYISASSLARGLGTNCDLPVAGSRARLFQALRWIYLRWLKSLLSHRLTESQRLKATAWVKHALSVNHSNPSRP